MLRLVRIFCVVLPALTGVSQVHAANTVSSPAAADTAPAAPLTPELQAELDALLQDAWHPSAAARVSLGWRDNILLSPLAPIERGFLRGEVDALLLRPMRDRWEFVSFLNGDVLRYFSPPPGISGEQQWSVHAEGRWQPVERARLSLKGAGYLRDLVVDLSETEARRVVEPMRVHGGYAIGATRLTWGKLHVEPSVQVKRTDYRDYAGDFDEVRGGGRVEWQHSPAFAVSAAWFEVQRRYDQRLEYNAGGRALDGTRLRFRQRDGEVKVRSQWERGGRWNIAGSIGGMENRDGAYGYFDYDQKRARLELEWRRLAWRLTLDAETKRMEYLVQTVGAGIAPPPRINDDHEVTFRAERELGSGWTIFGDYRWERSRSNEIEFCYRANTVLAGVERSF